MVALLAPLAMLLVAAPRGGPSQAGFSFVQDMAGTATTPAGGHRVTLTLRLAATGEVSLELSVPEATGVGIQVDSLEGPDAKPGRAALSLQGGSRAPRVRFSPAGWWSAQNDGTFVLGLHRSSQASAPVVDLLRRLASTASTGLRWRMEARGAGSTALDAVFSPTREQRLDLGAALRRARVGRSPPARSTGEGGSTRTLQLLDD